MMAHEQASDGVMRTITKQEVAAMWLYGEHYAESGLGAIAYYEQLSDSKKSAVEQMVRQITEAPNDSP